MIPNLANLALCFSNKLTTSKVKLGRTLVTKFFMMLPSSGGLDTHEQNSFSKATGNIPIVRKGIPVGPISPERPVLIQRLFRNVWMCLDGLEGTIRPYLFGYDQSISLFSLRLGTFERNRHAVLQHGGWEVSCCSQR